MDNNGISCAVSSFGKNTPLTGATDKLVCSCEFVPPPKISYFSSNVKRNVPAEDQALSESELFQPIEMAVPTTSGQWADYDVYYRHKKLDRTDRPGGQRFSQLEAN